MTIDTLKMSVFYCLRAVQTKAKVLRKYVDKMIALAKDGSLHARRQVGFGLPVYLRGDNAVPVLLLATLACRILTAVCAAGAGLRVQQEDRGAAV